MPSFRATYVEPGGATRVARIEGPSAAWVMQRLEQDGARNVSVHEDLLAPDGRDLDAEVAMLQRHAPALAAIPRAAGSPAPLDVAAFIDERLAGPRPKPLPTPGRAALGWLWPAGIFAVAAWLKRPASGATAGLGFKIDVALAVLLFGWGALAVTPLWLDGAARRARAWRDWPAVLRLTAVATWHPLIRSRPALRYGFGTLRAAALAGSGRLEEGLALIERVSKDNRMATSLVDNGKAGVYLAINRPDEAIELRRRVAQDPARHGSKVDLAIALLEHRGDIAGARQELAEVTTRPVSLLEAAFRSVAKGLIDLEEGRAIEAVAALTRARSAFEREAPVSTREGILLWTDPFLCLALARAGEVGRANAMLPRVTRFLEATSQPRWLKRCREALAEPAA
jgi:hypothetical protein